MKFIYKNGLVAVIITVFLGAILTPLVLAQDNTAEKTRETTYQKLEAARQAAKERRQELQQKVAERREGLKTRLEATKLRSCQNREKAIGNIMTRMSDRGQKHLDLFDTISERVQKFYTDKSLSLSNYDALLADVVAKKAAAQAAIDETKSTTVSFKCDGDDPKGAAEVFKGSLKDQKEALKAYRTAVKNLIVGVKSALPGSSSEGDSSEN